MSRTYHHGDKAKMCLFEGVKWQTSLWQHHLRDVEKPKRKRHADRFHWMRTPGWWIHDMITVSQRAQARALTTRVLKMHDIEEAPFFPHPRKPHHYYW